MIPQNVCSKAVSLFLLGSHSSDEVTVSSWVSTDTSQYVGPLEPECYSARAVKTCTGAQLHRRAHARKHRQILHVVRHTRRWHLDVGVARSTSQACAQDAYIQQTDAIYAASGAPFSLRWCRLSLLTPSIYPVLYITEGFPKWY